MNKKSKRIILVLLISIFFYFLPVKIISADNLVPTNKETKTKKTQTIQELNEQTYTKEKLYRQFGKINTNAKIYDYANLYTTKQEYNLYQKATEIINKYNMDIVILTIEDNNLGSAKIYAKSFYEVYNFGLNESKDGIILVINIEHNEYYIATSGKAIDIITVGKQNSINDAMQNNMINQDYYEATTNFLKKIQTYSYNYNYGSPYMWSLAVIASILLTIILVKIEIKKLHLVTDSLDASSYFNDQEIENETDLLVKKTRKIIHHESSNHKN